MVKRETFEGKSEKQLSAMGRCQVGRSLRSTGDRRPGWPEHSELGGCGGGNTAEWSGHVSPC